VELTVPYRPILEDYGVFGFGEEFRKHVETVYGELYTDKEWIEDYKSGLEENEKKRFESWLGELKNNGCGIIPIEVAICKAQHTRYISEILDGERLQPYSYPTEKAENFDVRVSELANNDALEVYKNRKGLAGEALERANLGTHAHVLSLQDPQCPPSKIFLDYYFLHYLENPVKRSDYCERPLTFQLNIDGKIVKLSATPDCVCHVPFTKHGVIFDLKSGSATPANPHRRYQRQVYGYSLTLKKHFDNMTGLIVYMQKTGIGYKLMDFNFSEKLKERTEWFIGHLAEWLPRLESEKEREYYKEKESPEVVRYLNG